MMETIKAIILIWMVILQTGTVIIDKKLMNWIQMVLWKVIRQRKNLQRRNLQISQLPLTSPVHLRQRSRLPLLLMMPALLQAVFWTVWKKIMQRQLLYGGYWDCQFSGRSKTHEKLGCELGNHTYDHKDLATLSSDEISSEIARVDEQLVNLTGEGASVVRPPYGSVNDTVNQLWEPRWFCGPLTLWTGKRRMWNLRLRKSWIT